MGLWEGLSRHRYKLSTAMRLQDGTDQLSHPMIHLGVPLLLNCTLCNAAGCWGVKKFVKLNFQGLVRLVRDSGGSYAFERA